MSTDKNHDSQEQDLPPRRAAYEKPAIEQSASFERLHLACAFAGGQTVDCTLSPKS
jgi:hypothetical protein